MSGWAGVSAVLVLVVAGCTRVIDSPQARPVLPVGPITAQQVRDLLSPNVAGVEGNQFDRVEPQRCEAVAREVAAPLLTSQRPAALDGGHWQNANPDVVVEEIVAVYPTDFDPGKALTAAREAVESCRDETLEVTTLQGRTYQFAVAPVAEADTDADTVRWRLAGTAWSCDNLLVAAHNAAIEITTCGPAGGLDTAVLAADALKRIDALANSTM